MINPELEDYQRIIEYMRKVYPNLNAANYPSVSVQDRKVNCGKCDFKHGKKTSYRYGFYRDRVTGKTKQIYLRKVTPSEKEHHSVIDHLFWILHIKH